MVEYSLCFKFKASNNEAEYESLDMGLKIARDLKVQHLKVYSDSQLFIGQVYDEYEDVNLTWLNILRKVKNLNLAFSSLQFK